MTDRPSVPPTLIYDHSSDAEDQLWDRLHERLQLSPDLRVIGFRSLELQRWMPMREEPVTLEITARVKEQEKKGQAGGEVVTDQPVSVRIEIRDLGNESYPDSARTVAVRGTVLLARDYPRHRRSNYRRWKMPGCARSA